MNKMNVYFVLTAALIAMVPLSHAEQSTASAASSSQPVQKSPGIDLPHSPPPEAYKACEGKTVGRRSNFTDPRGEILTGSCEHDDDGKLVLRPDRGKQDGSAGEHRGPPPEAYAACQNKSVGSRGQFISPRGDTIAGSCEKEGEKLVLRPDRAPRDNNERPN